MLPASAKVTPLGAVPPVPAGPGAAAGGGVAAGTAGAGAVGAGLVSENPGAGPAAVLQPSRLIVTVDAAVLLLLLVAPVPVGVT